MLYIFIIIEVGIIVGVVGPCFARAILLDFSEKPLGPSSRACPEFDRRDLAFGISYDFFLLQILPV